MSPNNPSQYYPCALDHNSWLIYQCPDQSIFDEASQKCLIKIPINDHFNQLAIDDKQFEKVASFIVPNREQKKNKIKPFSIKKLFNEVR